MLTEETKKELKTAPTDPEGEVTNEEPTPQEPFRGNWREAFVAAFQKARQQQKPTESRQELARDKSKSLFLLVGVCVVLLLIFFAVFSQPKKRIPLPGENPHGQASLGRKLTPGQENNDPTNAVNPMLSADGQLVSGHRSIHRNLHQLTTNHARHPVHIDWDLES